MVFALCDEEDFLGLLQSAVQLREERTDEEAGNWKREMGGDGELREKVTNIQRRLEAGLHREEEEVI